MDGRATIGWCWSLALAACGLPAVAGGDDPAPAGRPEGGAVELRLRRQVEAEPGSGRFEAREEPARWDPTRTAVVLCDLWDRHWCAGASARVAEMAPRVDRFVDRARSLGMLIIHAPSDTMNFYEGTPQRRLAQSAPPVEAAVPLRPWCPLDPAREAPLPIDDSDGGCDDLPACPQGRAWSRQIAAIRIADGDAVTDSAEAYYLMRHRGIENVLVLGVHTNMCVLGRPFSIRQLVNQGMNVALVRDLTDTMYNSRRPPMVDHFEGTRLVVGHIERYWCPTITSAELLGGEPFRFRGDAGAE